VCLIHHSIWHLGFCRMRVAFCLQLADAVRNVKDP
jgi:hypothetical protein